MSRTGLILLFSWLPVQALWAGVLQHMDVEHRAGRYTIDMQVTLEVPADAAYQTFTDYPNLNRVNDAIESSKVLEQDPQRGALVQSMIRVCVLIYCRRLNQTQWMRQIPPERLTADVVPEDSDFSFGHAEWRIWPCADGACLSFTAELEPSFWVPPIIGPWVVKRKLRQEAIQTCDGIERTSRARLQ